MVVVEAWPTYVLLESLPEKPLPGKAARRRGCQERLRDS